MNTSNLMKRHFLPSFLSFFRQQGKESNKKGDFVINSSKLFEIITMLHRNIKQSTNEDIEVKVLDR